MRKNKNPITGEENPIPMGEVPLGKPERCVLPYPPIIKKISAQFRCPYCNEDLTLIDWKETKFDCIECNKEIELTLFVQR
jgi:DNA-directed RNA polymerase subunit RPC12/RpoP